MPTANPLEQLRRRMLSQTTPAAFAALAEEHRRAGRFAEAIAVCQDGLARYPTYVSARVTLGRALLDSGDVANAVAELEQAVAQAPDNLAAVRALEGARVAFAELPAPPAPAEVAPTVSADPADAILTQAGDDPLVEEVVLAGGAGEADAADWRQAFGLGADHPQEFGLTPDWTVPAADTADTQPTSGGPAFEWTLDAPDESSAEIPSLDPEDTQSSSWDAPTVVWDATQVVETTDDTAVDFSADPAAGGSGVWDNLLVEPVSDGAAPSVFAGWDEPGPAVAERPDWGGEPPVAAEERGAGGEESGAGERGTSAAPVLAAGAAGTDQVAAPAEGWAGSLASAIDEVFTQAGQPAAILEPAPHTSPGVRAALADAAVEAAIEDTATDPAMPPALVSLQQMLDAVRARRAALSADRDS